MGRGFKLKLTAEKRSHGTPIREDNAAKPCAANRRDWETTSHDSSLPIRRVWSAWRNCVKECRSQTRNLRPWNRNYNRSRRQPWTRLVTCNLPKAWTDFELSFV